MKDCNWMTVSQMTKYYSILQLWKTTKWGKPDYLFRKLQEEDHDRLSTDIPRLLLTAGSFRCKSVLYWNQLPQSLRCENSVSKFKNCLKRWIIDSGQDGRGAENDQFGNGRGAEIDQFGNGG